MSVPLAANPAERSGSVTIAWDPNPAPDVTGYRVHYGSESQDYTEVIDVGPVTEQEITGLTKGQSYFFSVTAYNKYDVDSDFAEELVIHALPETGRPTAQQEFRINRMTCGANHLMTFEVSGMIGDTVEVWASCNLADWTLIDTIVHAGSPITIQDPAANGQPRRFYQLRIPRQKSTGS